MLNNFALLPLHPLILIPCLNFAHQIPILCPENKISLLSKVFFLQWRQGQHYHVYLRIFFVSLYILKLTFSVFTPASRIASDKNGWGVANSETDTISAFSSLPYQKKPLNKSFEYREKVFQIQPWKVLQTSVRKYFFFEYQIRAYSFQSDRMPLSVSGHQESQG